MIILRFQLLYSHGLDIRSRNDMEETPIHLAAKYGYGKLVRVIAHEEKDTLKDVDDHFRTPLHLAASGGHLQTVTELLRLGADTSDL